MCCSAQPEELTLLLIKLRRQQAELNSLREHTVAQLMALGMEGPNAKVSIECIHLSVHARMCASPASSENRIFCVYVCPQEAPGVKQFSPDQTEFQTSLSFSAENITDRW